MKKTLTRAMSLLLSVILCVWVLPASPASAVGDAMELPEVKALINAEKLHPQRTGYREIDDLLEGILAPCKGSDAYTKIVTLYDWSVSNIEYDWEGYSQNFAPAYDCFTLKYDLAYETGLPQAYPMDMIYRTYHALTAKKAVCYDWAILFAVMARYVGIDSYVRTGELTIGTWHGHHGWTELRLGGKGYIFDAQQDNRSRRLAGRIIHDHFGIAPDHSQRYAPETAVNSARDKLLLPITAPRVRVARVKVTASASGAVIGAGTHEWGSEVTQSAGEGSPAVAWYTPDGTLLGEEDSFTFFLNGDAEIYALFEGDRFVDIPADAWYLKDVTEAADRGYIAGMTPLTFQGEGGMTRAMLVALIARMEGADLSAASPCDFVDVKQNSWYAPAVNWAVANEVVFGVSATHFAPDEKVSREQAAAMLMRVLRRRGTVGEEEAPAIDFADAKDISPYAVADLARARQLGILAGYGDGTVRPQAVVTRAEGAALLMRTVRLY